jgi:uncharacterized glyoxalase superfamily protein PhnB
MARTNGARTTQKRKPASPKARRPAAPAARARASRATTLAAPRPAKPVSGLAPGMQPISAYLAVANVGASAAFLETALGFTRGVVLAEAGAEARYAEMRHGASTVVLVRKADATSATGGAAGLYTYVDDLDRQLAAAREAGAGVDSPEDKPWGDRVATVIDPDGYRWVLATFKKLVPFS